MKDTEHDYGTHFCLERGGEGQQRGNQGAKESLRILPGGAGGGSQLGEGLVPV